MGRGLEVKEGKGAVVRAGAVWGFDGEHCNVR